MYAICLYLPKSQNNFKNLINKPDDSRPVIKYGR